MKGALLRYRVMSYVTGVVLALGTIAALLKYAGGPELPGYSALWIGHGWLYMIYLVTVLDLGIRARFGLAKIVGVCLAGTIPFAAFFVEPRIHRSVERLSNDLLA